MGSALPALPVSRVQNNIQGGKRGLGGRRQGKARSHGSSNNKEEKKQGMRG